ncbi:unnamed protein product [Peniophora sp. CBMAI 1063]|nr:unnamed protein product [Peniophora sp. CBMAI 1063]
MDSPYADPRQPNHNQTITTLHMPQAYRGQQVMNRMLLRSGAHHRAYAGGSMHGAPLLDERRYTVPQRPSNPLAKSTMPRTSLYGPPYGLPPLGGPGVGHHNFERPVAPYNQAQGYSDFANALTMGPMPGGLGYHGSVAGPSAGPSNGIPSHGYQHEPVHQNQQGAILQSTLSSTYNQSGAMVQSRQLTATGHYYGEMRAHTAGNVNHPPAMAPPDANPFDPFQHAMYLDPLAAVAAPVPAPATGVLPGGPLFPAGLAAGVPGGATNFGQAINTDGSGYGHGELYRGGDMYRGILPDEGSFGPTEGRLNDLPARMPHGVVRTIPRHTTRGYAHPGAPYPSSRVAAPSADPDTNNFTSIIDIVLGGIQDNISDGVQPSHHGAAQAVAGPSTSLSAPANEADLTGWQLQRLHWISKKFLDQLTPAQSGAMVDMFAEGTERSGGGWRCIWIESNGVPCKKSGQNFTTHGLRDRHVYETHHHHKVLVGDKEYTRPLVGVSGGRTCRFCPQYIPRCTDGGYMALQHEWACWNNPDRLPVADFPGKKALEAKRAALNLSDISLAINSIANELRIARAS